MSVIETLLNDLFLCPNPITSRAEIYRQLQDRIFPNKELFIKYLTTDSSNEQTEIAKQLIQRLCFESHFSPPYSILLNLLEFEKSDANKPDNGIYIPQDHFQHTLNTYMLGIYIFFYQPQINKRLTQEFMTRKDEGNPVLNSTKDFVSFWKYFCLFHDVSYPMEVGYPWNDKHVILRPDCEKYVTCYNSISIYLVYEWIATIIAHLIVINEILNDSDNLSLPSYFTNYHFFTTSDPNIEDISTEQIKIKFRDYKCLDKVFDYDHYKVFSGFIDEKDCVTVVYDMVSGEPVCFRLYDNNSDAPKDYLKESLSNSQLLDEIKELLETEEPLHNKKYGIKYFVKNATEHFHQSLVSVICDHTECFIPEVKDYLDGYELQQTAFTEGQCREISLAVSSEDIDDLIFYYYTKAYNFIIDSFESKPYSGNMFEYIEEKDSNSYHDYMKSKFSEIILDEAKALIEQNATDGSDLLKQWEKDGYPVLDNALCHFADCTGKKPSHSLSEYVKEYISTGFTVQDSQITIVSDTIANRINKEIQAGMSKAEAMVTLFDYLFNSLNTFIRKNTNDVSSCDAIKNVTLAPRENPSTIGVFNTINGFIENNMYKNNENEKESASYAARTIEKKLPGSTIQDVFEHYRNKKTPNTIDHGLMGSIIALYSQLISHCFVPEIKKKDGKYVNETAAFLCPLFWSIDTKNYYKKLISNYANVFSRVFSSIMCHNIYPEQIDWTPSDGWKFNLRENPCEYYGMLIDALQLWRRDRYHHQNISFVPLYSMDSYDIKAGGKTISISVNSYTNRIGRLHEDLTGYDSYLTYFSSLVKLSIIS